MSGFSDQWIGAENSETSVIAESGCGCTLTIQSFTQVGYLPPMRVLVLAAKSIVSNKYL